MNSFDQSWKKNLKKPVEQKVVAQTLRKEGREIELPEEETPKGCFNFGAIILLIAIVITFTFFYTNYFGSPRVWTVDGKVVVAIDPLTGKDINPSQLPLRYTEIKTSSRD